MKFVNSKTTLVKFFMFAACSSLSFAPMTFAENAPSNATQNGVTTTTTTTETETTAVVDNQANKATHEAKTEAINTDTGNTQVANTEAAATPKTTTSTTADADKKEAHKNVNVETKRFIIKAATGNMAEEKFSDLAKKQAASEEVKDFAETMRADHVKANDNLLEVAKDAGVSVLNNDELTDPEAKKEYNTLAKLSGNAFDKEYMRLAVKCHTKAVAEYKKASSMNLQNEELKKYVADTLPVVERHLAMAKELEAKVTGEKSSNNNDTTKNSNHKSHNH